MTPSIVIQFRHTDNGFCEDDDKTLTGVVVYMEITKTGAPVDDGRLILPTFCDVPRAYFDERMMGRGRMRRYYHPGVTSLMRNLSDEGFINRFEE